MAAWGDSVFSYSTKKLQKVLTSQTGQDLIHRCLTSPADDVTEDKSSLRWNPEGFVERELSIPRPEKRKRLKVRWKAYFSTSLVTCHENFLCLILGGTPKLRKCIYFTNVGSMSLAWFCCLTRGVVFCDSLVVRELFNALSVDTSGSSIHFIESKNYVIDANIYACNLYFGLYSVKNDILRGN